MSTFNHINLFDIKILNKFKHSLGEGADEFILIFYGHIEENINKALEEIKNENFEQLGFYCHRIKSNIKTIGGLRLEAICIEIEKLSKARHYDKIKKILPDFENCYEQTALTIQENI